MSDPHSLAVPMTSASDRWDSWKAKGRADDTRFRHRLRMVVIDVGAALAFGSAIWVALQF